MKKLFFILTVIFNCIQADAQKIFDTTTVDLMDEFLTVQYLVMGHDSDSYRKYGSGLIYETVDVDTVTTTDFGYIWCYSKANNLSFTKSNSPTIIQNENYRLSIYNSDSLLTIGKPEPAFKILLGIDIADSLFQEFAMESMTAADSGAYRKITIHFNQEAPFNTYELCYRKSDYKIHYIFYAIKKGMDIESPYQTTMSMFFPEYTDVYNDDINFSMDSYITVIAPNDIRTSTNTVNWDILSLLNQ
jgi:hypothetical protein